MCSAYFVRRHKKNVHGIGDGAVSETVIPEPGQEADNKFFTHQQIEEQELSQQQQQLQQTEAVSLQQFQLDLSQQQQQQQQPPSESALVVKVPKKEREPVENATVQFDDKGQKSYKCDICDKVLQSKYNLK